jgi:hypothetical protein
VSTCPARTAPADYAVAHTCDFPLACAMTRLVDGVSDEEFELDRLHDLLDKIEDLCQDSKAKVAQEILTKIHTVRGGPRE